MPEPLLYLKSMIAAAIVSALIVLAMVWPRRRTSRTWLNSACVLAMGLSLFVGCNVLAVRWTWPPLQGLDRFLMIVLPLALAVELLAGIQGIPRRVAWCLRAILAAAVPRILLHGSVYLNGEGNHWTWSESGGALMGCSSLLAGTWGLLYWLSQRSRGISIPVALGLTIQCAGLSVMLAGYLKGGATAFPLAATIIATTIVAKLITMRSGAPADFDSPAIIGIGVIGLFGVLLIGRFFGRVSTGCALALLLIPLLCWTAEMPFLRNRKAWLVGFLRLVLVAISLVVVLLMAKRDFDRKMAPLLGDIPRQDLISRELFWRSPGSNGHCISIRLRFSQQNMLAAADQSHSPTSVLNAA